jgi:excisionase family DNA binding protein
MKLNELYANVNEGSNEDETVRKAPAPGKTGDLITTAQAAKLLNVEMSRVRQLVGDGTLKSYGPEEGRRDHFLKKSEVEAHKSKEKDKGGRPAKSDNG